jgi:hypothetical protein
LQRATGGATPVQAGCRLRYAEDLNHGQG